MRKTVEFGIRERRGEPELHATILAEGRVSTGVAKDFEDAHSEVFAPGAARWPADGIGIAVEHTPETETRAHPIRKRNGEITVVARATERIRAAFAAGKRFMSIEYWPVSERVTAAGVREVTEGLLQRAVLTDHPVFDTTSARLRSGDRRRWWLSA